MLQHRCTCMCSFDLALPAPFRYSSNKVECTFFVAHEWSGIMTYIEQTSYFKGPKRPIFIEIIHGASQWAESWYTFGNITTIADILTNTEERRQWDHADWVIYTSYYIQNYIRSEWGNRKDESAIVIPNLVPSHLTQKPTYNMTKTRNLCFAGMMTRRKGYDRFINILCGYTGTQKVVGHVFAKIIHKEVEWARNLCNATFVFHGPVTTSELWPTIRGLNGMLMFMSRHDNQPMVPLEAGFNGVPTMSSPTGGFREIIENADKVIMPDVPTMIKTLNTVLESQDVTFMVPRLNTDPKNALKRWKDMLVFALNNHRQDGIPDFPNSRHIEIHDAAKWNESDHCVDETYAGFIVLYHADSWMPMANLTQYIHDYVSSLPLAHLQDIILPDWQFKNGTRGLAWEPFMWMQFGWKSCFPSTPIVMSEHAFCQWKDYVATTGGGKPPLHPDTILPHIGIWATNANMRTKRVHEPWFTLKNNIVDARDCIWDNMQVALHYDPWSITYKREYNTTRRIIRRCVTEQEKTVSIVTKRKRDKWLRTALKPMACGRNRTDGMSTLQDQLSAECFSYCIRHPSHELPNHGWIFNMYEDCWWYTVDMTASRLCRPYLSSLQRNIFPWEGHIPSPNIDVVSLATRHIGADFKNLSCAEQPLIKDVEEQLLAPHPRNLSQLNVKLEAVVPGQPQNLTRLFGSNATLGQKCVAFCAPIVEETWFKSAIVPRGCGPDPSAGMVCCSTNLVGSGPHQNLAPNWQIHMRTLLICTLKPERKGVVHMCVFVSVCVCVHMCVIMCVCVRVHRRERRRKGCCVHIQRYRCYRCYYLVFGHRFSTMQ